MDRNTPDFRALQALMRFIGSLRAHLGLMGLGLGILGLRQTRVRARLRVLRWHGRHSAEVNENINLGYSQDQGYS